MGIIIIFIINIISSNFYEMNLDVRNDNDYHDNNNANNNVTIKFLWPPRTGLKAITPAYFYCGWAG
jgi:hypothetical protein